MSSNIVTLGTATYVVARHFTRQEVTKQELLRSLLLQNLERVQSVDPGAIHGV